MPGKPGMTGEGMGGPRPGAGRPPQSRRIRLGDQFAVIESDSAGAPVWTVEELNRTRIVFRSDDGRTITLLIYSRI